MGVQSHFDKFHDKIKLGRKDDVYANARERGDSITSDVKDAFADANHPVTEAFIQGSLATHTAIVSTQDDFDVDRALVISSADAPVNPVDPKKVVLGVLEARGFTNAKIKTPCVTADYASESLHIDFPVYKKDGSQYSLAVGKKTSDENNREWSAADPKGLIDWVNDGSHLGDSVDKKRNQFRRVVRYLKRWRDVQFGEPTRKKVYSIGLTVMARSHFSPAFDDEGTRQDLKAMRETVSRMLSGSYFTAESIDQHRVSVALPVQPWRDIFDGSSLETGTQLRNKLTNLKEKLEQAEAEPDVREQCKILNKLFGSDFVVPDPPTGGKKSGGRAIHPSAGAVGTSQGA